MATLNRQTLVGTLVGMGLLLLGGSVYADQVLDCQLLKIRAAADRAKCVVKERSDQLKGNPFSLDSCEAQFDAAIAAAGNACRYVDNGDGTVSDLNTLLMWEKKVPGKSSTTDGRGVGTCLHCVDDRYMWNTAMSEWLSAINGPTNTNASQTGYAGCEDWRLPNIVELGSIWNGLPFPGPTSDVFGLGRYWTSSSMFGGVGAWYIDCCGMPAHAQRMRSLRMTGLLAFDHESEEPDANSHTLFERPPGTGPASRGAHVSANQPAWRHRVHCHTGHHPLCRSPVPVAENGV